MQKEWYVLQALTGREAKAKESILRRLKIEEMQEFVGDVEIPSEKVSEVKKGKKSTSTRLFYPGYVLVQLALYADEQRKKLNETCWYFVTETPGIIGFIGNNERPQPLKPDEVDAILHQADAKKEAVKPKVQFEPGESVKITDGPFLNFSGVIEEVDPVRGKLKVSVSIFGRTAPVELEYWQVERVE